VQGGRVVPLDYLNAVRDLAHAHGAKVHLDGARITNAHVKSGIAIAEYASYADSVMFCLSKGLCAPAGSMLCGAAELIERGVEVRQTFGGFPKQAAPLAAAGIVAIDKMIPRLAEDHDNATRLAQGLRAVDGVEQHLDIEDVETNMVFVRVKSMDADAFVDALASRGVLAYHFGGGRVRFVTHRDVTASHVERAISVITEVLKENGEKPAKRGTDVT